MNGKRYTPAPEEDLEATAELPMPEYSTEATRPALPALSDAAMPTDVYPVPAVPVGAAELADSLREVEQRLLRQQERVQELETRLAEADARREELAVTLAKAREQWAQREAQLRGEIDAAGTALAEARTQLTARLTMDQHHVSDLAELRRRSERQLEALTSWQGFRSLSDSLLAEAEARSAALESRVRQLGESLRAAEAAPAAPVAMLAAPPAPEPASAPEPVQQEQDVEALQAELAAARGRQQEAEARAAAMAERAQHLEAELQSSATLLTGLQQYVERLGREDSGRHAVLGAPPAEGVMRMLVRHDAGADVVYPLGRRTTIGRTPDNDIQIDTVNVSRHHAALLSNADHCVIEDLNSTNGVVVNGRRVVRQILHDGDTVTIGKTEFRFQQRT